MQSRDLPPDVIAALATLIHYVKGAIRESVELHQNEDASGAYYDAKSSPMGPTSFLRLAREGAFPACKVGRKVLARRADVDGWLQARAGERTANRAAADTSAEAEEEPFDALALCEKIAAPVSPIQRGKPHAYGRGRS